MSDSLSCTGHRSRTAALGILIAAAAACAILGVAGCGAQPRPPETDTRPNIVLVLVDALRWDGVGYSGYDKPTTPYLDSLAGDGVVFDQAYSHCSKTLASTASMLTGVLFPPIVHVKPDEESTVALDRLVRKGRSVNILAPTRETYIERLAGNGYETVGALTNPHHHAYSGFPDLFEQPLVLFDGWSESDTPYARGSEVNAAVQQWMAARTDDRPAFLYVHYMDVHWPYRPLEPYASEFVTTDGTDRYLDVVYRGATDVDERDVEYMRQNYDAEVRYVDAMIEELHRSIVAASGRPTVLIVTADHGEEFMDHGGLGHGRTLELELIRVPLLIHGVPDAQPSRVSPIVRQIDLGPTILDIAGIAHDDIGEGRSLIPLVREQGPAARAEAPPNVARYGGMLSYTIDGWHFIRGKEAGDLTLYDTARDPLGMSNIAASMPDRADELDRELDPFQAALTGSIRTASSIAEERFSGGRIPILDDSTHEQLEALGYIE